jgi:hypothetical protein
LFVKVEGGRRELRLKLNVSVMSGVEGFMYPNEIGLSGAC